MFSDHGKDVTLFHECQTIGLLQGKEITKNTADIARRIMMNHHHSRKKCVWGEKKNSQIYIKEHFHTQYDENSTGSD